MGTAGRSGDLTQGWIGRTHDVSECGRECAHSRADLWVGHVAGHLHQRRPPCAGNSAPDAEFADCAPVERHGEPRVVWRGRAGKERPTPTRDATGADVRGARYSIGRTGRVESDEYRRWSTGHLVPPGDEERCSGTPLLGQDISGPAGRRANQAVQPQSVKQILDVAGLSPPVDLDQAVG